MIKYTGTIQQQEIAKKAIAQIKFPFHILPDFTIGWMDLNDGTFALMSEEEPTDEETEPHHVHEHGHSHGDPHPLEGYLNGLRYIMGVFYPSNGNIFVDNALVNYPSLAASTISAEVAHGVDQALLNNTKRAQINLLLHNGVQDAHTWWEKVSYSKEYYSLVGESFMILFTKAYSDIPFSGANSFVHNGENVTGAQIRNIIGIQRTDVAPTVNVQPTVTTATAYLVYGNSKVYHLPTHYKNIKFSKTLQITNTAGYTPCAVCVKKLKMST